MGYERRRRRLDSAGFTLEQIVRLDIAAKNARFPIGRKSCLASNSQAAASESSMPPCEPTRSLRTWRGSPQAAKWSADAAFVPSSDRAQTLDRLGPICRSASPKCGAASGASRSVQATSYLTRSAPEPPCVPVLFLVGNIRASRKTPTLDHKGQD